ncbi:MAG: hypothetical protein AB1458_05830 [Bacteroidota bacterium]
MKESRTTTAHLVMGDDGILRIHIFEGALIRLQDVHNHYESAHRLTGNQKALVLVYGNVNYRITREAQRYAATQAHTRRATAVLTSKRSVMFITWLYRLFFRPATPIRPFTSEEKALAWLKSFQK